MRTMKEENIDYIKINQVNKLDKHISGIDLLMTNKKPLKNTYVFKIGGMK